MRTAVLVTPLAAACCVAGRYPLTVSPRCVALRAAAVLRTLARFVLGCPPTARWAAPLSRLKFESAPSPVLPPPVLPRTTLPPPGVLLCVLPSPRAPLRGRPRHRHAPLVHPGRPFEFALSHCCMSPVGLGVRLCGGPSPQTSPPLPTSPHLSGCCSFNHLTPLDGAPG